MKNIIFFLSMMCCFINGSFQIFRLKKQGVSVEIQNLNILIILLYDQGYHDVSYYGTKDISDPNYWFAVS